MTELDSGNGGQSVKIAVMIPCFNEELTVAKVVRDFRTFLPSADIYVYDNNSTDRTVEMARESGAIVRSEKRQGKGYVVQRMFAEIDADVYVMVDGDDTYPAELAGSLTDPIINGSAEIVVGSRLMSGSNSELKKLNRVGNKLFLWTVNRIFNVRLTDILSGYRAFSRNFVKTLPLFGGGFETETELTIKSLVRGYEIVEVPVNLGLRADGSRSKINIVSDGLRIANIIFALFRDYRPLMLFGIIGLVLMLIGLAAGAVVVYEFIETGLVFRLPTAVMSVGLELAGLLCLTIGLVLHTVVRRSMELEYQLSRLFRELDKVQRDRINSSRDPHSHN